MDKPLTPREKTQLLRARLEKVLTELPEKWINLFMFTFPDYSDKMAFLANVGRGKSLDEDVIEKMEKLAKTLNTLKK